MTSSSQRGTSQSPQGYMRQKEVLSLFPFSAATLWRNVRSGRFPKPRKLSARVTAWNRADVFQWLHEQEGKQ